MPRGPLHAVATILALLVGIAGGAAALWSAAPRLPSDLARHRWVHAAVQRGDAPLVVFGNSIGMSGVDAGQLGAGALNLCTVGQQPGESLVYQSLLGPEVRVVQLVTPIDVAVPGGVATAATLDFMRLIGVPIDPEVARRLASASPSAGEKLAKPMLQVVLDARSLPRAALDAELRRRVRDDLRDARAVSDLKFPAPYLRRAPAAEIDAELEVMKAATPASPAPVEEKLALLSEMSRQHATLFTLAPLHPRLREQLDPGYCDALEAAVRSATQATVLNACALLSEDEFLDHVHPTRAGAARLTAAIARALGD